MVTTLYVEQLLITDKLSSWFTTGTSSSTAIVLSKMKSDEGCVTLPSICLVVELGAQNIETQLKEDCDAAKQDFRLGLFKQL